MTSNFKSTDVVSMTSLLDKGVGKRGIRGKRGRTGNDGTDGTDGKNGTNGTNGTDGKNGTNGTNGTNGANGSPAFLVATGTFNATQLASLETAPIPIIAAPPAGSYILIYSTKIVATVIDGSIVGLDRFSALVAGSFGHSFWNLQVPTATGQIRFATSGLLTLQALQSDVSGIGVSATRVTPASGAITTGPNTLITWSITYAVLPFV